VQVSAAVLLRRRAAAVVAAAVVCAASAGAVELAYLWIKGSGLFQLHSVAVRGGTESERIAVRDAVARAAAGRSLLALSSGRLARQIEQVPTIRSASVDRDFPHTLRIHIVPERAVALAIGPGGYRSLVAASGRVLRVFARQDAVPVLPRVWPGHERPIPGGTIRAAGAQAALDALAARPPDFGATVANVKMEPERGIVMRLRGGLDIVLGPPLQLQQKLRAAAWVLHHYPTSAERAQLVYADVSAPALPAVMPRGGYAPTAGLGQHKKARANGPQTAQNGA
jgi:cell division protein FtsQ